MFGGWLISCYHAFYLFYSLRTNHKCIDVTITWLSSWGTLKRNSPKWTVSSIVVIFSYFSPKRIENVLCRQRSHRAHGLKNFLWPVLFSCFILFWRFFCLGLCFQSLFSFEEKLFFFFQVIFLWKKKMERFDGRRVTRYNVNQYLSRAVSVQKTLSKILASTVVRKKTPGSKTRQRNLSLQP